MKFLHQVGEDFKDDFRHQVGDELQILNRQRVIDDLNRFVLRKCDHISEQPIRHTLRGELSDSFNIKFQIRYAVRSECLNLVESVTHCVTNLNLCK